MSKRKTNLSLVGHAIARLGTGYVYGTYGHVLTESLLAGNPYLTYSMLRTRYRPACLEAILHPRGHWTVLKNPSPPATDLVNICNVNPMGNQSQVPLARQ